MTVPLCDLSLQIMSRKGLQWVVRGRLDSLPSARFKDGSYKMRLRACDTPQSCTGLAIMKERKTEPHHESRYR